MKAKEDRKMMKVKQMYNRQSSPRTGWVALTAISILFVMLCSAYSQTPVVAQDSSSVVVASDSLNDTVAEELDAYTAEPVLVYDSSSPALRSVEEDATQKYLSDSDFDYARKDSPPTSFIEMILKRIADLLGKLFGKTFDTSLVQYLIAGLALALVIYLLIRSEFSAFFQRKQSASTTIDFDEIEENIGQMNFDALIAQALAAGNLRRAVRLRYLYLLRTMSERNLIEWRIDKTNSDYLYELRQPELRPGFTNLTRVFDYVWYGGFQIERGHYDRISRDFDDFTRTVQGAKV